MQPVDDAPGYQVLDEAGRGGFAVVYRAYQERLDRVVALKVLSVDRVDQRTLRHFQRELQLTGRLTGHPNVVTVFDTGVTRSGKPYIAMDYFENGSLRDRVGREGPLPLPDVLKAGVKLAGALAAVHEAGVLHGDIKPQNILISRYGEPAIADFGVARVVDSSEVSASAHAFTPLHAAPEVLSGQPHSVLTDIYSLGSTLYHLLAGQPAFHSPTDPSIAPLMFRVLSNEPPPIGRADVPPVVAEVVLRAMAKKPHERYGTARAFAQRLREVQAELGLPVSDLIGADPGPGSATVPRTNTPGPSTSSSSPFAPPVMETGSGLGRSVAETGASFGRSEAGTNATFAPPGSPLDASAPPHGGGPGPLPAGPPAAFGGGMAAPSGQPSGPLRGQFQEPPPGAPLPNAAPVGRWSTLDEPPVGAPQPQSQPHPGPQPHPRPQPQPGPHVQPGPQPQHGPQLQPGPLNAPLPISPVPPALPPSGLGRATAGKAEQSGTKVKLAIGLTVTVVVVVGTSLALFLSRQQEPPRVPVAGKASPAATPSAEPPQIDEKVLAALRPRKVKVVGDQGTTVTLKWVLPSEARRYPLVVQRAPADTGQALTSLEPGTTTTRLVGLTKDLGYCFVVGVPLAISETSSVAWSDPVCIRGAMPAQ